MRFLQKLDINLLLDLAESYGIKVEQVAPGEGGLVLNGKKLSPEEAMNLIFEEFREVNLRNEGIED